MSLIMVTKMNTILNTPKMTYPRVQTKQIIRSTGKPIKIAMIGPKYGILADAVVIGNLNACLVSACRPMKAPVASKPSMAKLRLCRIVIKSFFTGTAPKPKFRLGRLVMNTTISVNAPHKMKFRFSDMVG